MEILAILHCFSKNSGIDCDEVTSDHSENLKCICIYDTNWNWNHPYIWNVCVISIRAQFCFSGGSQVSGTNFMSSHNRLFHHHGSSSHRSDNTGRKDFSAMCMMRKTTMIVDVY